MTKIIQQKNHQIAFKGMSSLVDKQKNFVIPQL